MSSQASEILMKYWGYPSFRPMQEEIIESVHAGNDTLALLPTGGGKSICFQVPAMMKDGLCLVITPLIALMKDQVHNLKQKNIPAAAVFSGMHPNEVEIVYNQAVFGRLKFLYVSPERLTTERFLTVFRRMNINLIAVDESHCISQWGYDFRPPYLLIHEIRPYFPKVPILALTATATKKVVLDIMEKLHFRSSNVFQSSYERKNLTYNVILDADKFGHLVRIFQRMSSGSGIVYVRNRRRTRELADYLTARQVPATFYHAGLDGAQRDARQKAWMQGRVKVMVATNAFGMGIDKPDVRIVVHMDLPDSLEAYFQEAGRAGRDGKQAQAYLLVSDQDAEQLQNNLNTSYPPIEQVRTVYQALGNYLQLPIGSGKDLSFDFQLAEFVQLYNFSVLETFNSLQLLEKEGLIMFGQQLKTVSKIFIQASREDLYRFQIEQPNYNEFVKTILRTYPGIFTDFVNLYETELARKSELTVQRVQVMLNYMNKLGLITYVPLTDIPQLLFLSERIDPQDIQLSRENYADRKASAAEKVQSVIDFVYNDLKCRSLQLLAYFGEEHNKRCGKCDVCVQRNRLELTDIEYNSIKESMKILLSNKAASMEEIVSFVTAYPETKVLEAVRWMIDHHILQQIDGERYIFRQLLTRKL